MLAVATVTPALSPAHAVMGGAAMPMSATDESKVPHYFGPYSNWANSPQVLSDAVVTLNGDGAGAEAQPVVDPKTGAIASIDVTSPGTGYTAAPSVDISSPGVTPTSPASAHATISAGVVTSIAVAEAGFGFAAPAVTISGGGTPSATATAQASGGVDDITLTAAGSGYVIKAIVEFSLPDAAYCTPPVTVPATPSPCSVATATATTDSAGNVTGLAVVDPGSGYTSAPTVRILDGPNVNPTAATATATIGIGRIDVTNGGAGYDAVPTVTVADTVGTADKGASATATIAAKGAVTGIVVDAPGAGYLTPGLKKFVDSLAGLGPNAANNLGNYIPVAQPDTTTYPGTDYYEIAVVQYRHQFASGLPATLERGYVQISTTVVPGAHVALSNANLDPSMPDTPIAGFFGVDKPRYLGPTIVASKDRPVRILFRNLLPTGVDGDLFLPVDTSIMGAGAGPNAMMLDENNVPMDMVNDEGSVTDGVRNPMCGQMPKPPSCYSENRATLHLHGGITPWISDGTPHQWTTPAGEGTDYPKGVSVTNVPDMPDPGPGAETFFYTNQQSARLMFYHDHAWGITRLNVYAGEAAGYLLTDAMETKLTAPDGALAGLGVGTPLIIQDKTFVSKDVHATDPTWDTSRWGGEGSLWTPHVYMPAQNPGSPTGQSGFGRWMYGPWFWPPAKDVKYPPIANPYYDPKCDPNTASFCEPKLIPSTPNVSVGMEAFNDTPIVNGTAYPTTSVDPKSYRFRILNAANDRFWNLQWYVADPTTGTLSEVALNPAEVAAAQTDPNVFPTPDTAKSPAGPSWVQIGTEGGFLPAPTVIPNQPMTWITDPTRFDFGNADKHSLLMAPAERADVIVDFSAYRGKTLILYNDAPAAFPARVSSYDYYTGGPDLSPVGAPTTLPGYGPNTRTIMQVKVSNAAPALAWDRPNTTADRMGALQAAFAHHKDASGKPAGVFESGSDPIVVGQAAYNGTYGTSFASAGDCSTLTAPDATKKCDGYARIQQQGGEKFTFDTLSGNQLSIPLQPKAIHDEMNSANFDEWGRMTANLGVEAPGATPLLQNIVLYPYVNPTTETLDADGLPSSLAVTPISSASDGTQIWKITHNGVDTHPIHFHLYDVQVINRVTWDNIIMPPEPNELGWKDTVRISPLEDTYVAVRPIVPTIPFGVPNSKRLLNPMMPEHAKGKAAGPNGTQAGFNNTDVNGNPIDAISNEYTDFGWEYVYHCHILSHEEMDMMRPVTVAVSETAPDSPDPLTITRPVVGLHWVDGTPVDYTNPSTWHDPKAEIGYRIERAQEVSGGVRPADADFAKIGNGLANSTSYADNPPDPSLTYWYRVTAYNAAGDSPSAYVRVIGVPKPPTALTATVQLDPSTASGSKVTLDWVNNAPNASSVVVERATGAGAFTTLATLTGTDTAVGPATYTDATVLPGTYRYQVKAVNAVGSSAYAGPVSVTIAQAASTTTLTSSANPSVGGSPVTFTATVTSSAASSTPSGSVDFSVDGSVTATVALDGSGVASWTAPSLVVGSHTIGAAYAGDTVYTPSSDSLTQVVTGIPTRTVVTSSLNPSTYGQTVSFTATVAPTVGTVVPTGTVQFLVDGVATGAPVALGPTGQAVLATSALHAGSHTVSAVYSGSALHAASTSADLTQVVAKAASSVAVTQSSTTSRFGQSVTFTAQVTPATATGNVQFVVDGVSGASVALGANGRATLVTSTLAVGNHTVSVRYFGSSDYLPSTSANLTHRVVRSATRVVLVTRPNPATRGTTVAFTATVSAVAPGSGVPTGTVRFRIDGVNVPTTTTLVGGVAVYRIATLSVGRHTISVTYNGSASYQPSTTGNVRQRIR